MSTFRIIIDQIKMATYRAELASLETDPVGNLNSLNQLIPSLIEAYGKATKSKEVHRVLEAVVKLREILKGADLLTGKESVAIASQSTEGVTNPAKKFVVERVQVLLKSLATGMNEQNLMQVVDMLVLFIQDALEGRDGKEQLQYVCECSLIKDIFRSVVSDLTMFEIAREDLIDQSLDGCLVMLTVLRESFTELKLKDVYEILTTMPKLDSTELSLTFIQDGEDSQDDDASGDELKEKEVSSVREEVLSQTQQVYQQVWLLVLAQVAKKGNKMVKQTLFDLPQKILPNFGNPLLLADFLMGSLEEKSDLQNQVYALKGLFLLLSKHGLDCPKYYDKLYQLLLPQRIPCGKGFATKSVFSMDHDTKSRFLRLLDLSLRAPTLPSKLIAAYLKRLARLIVSHGEVSATGDIMFVISLIANLVKRHPRCYRLIHRKTTSLSLGKRLSSDPYNADETDPLLSKALKSSLWELEIVMKQHYDQSVRDFCKVLKTDLVGKQTYFKSEDFIAADSLSLLKQDILDLDIKKEATRIRKNLLASHGQAQKETDQNILGKRQGDRLDSYGEFNQAQDLGFQGKRARMGEQFEKFEDFFQFDD